MDAKTHSCQRFNLQNVENNTEPFCIVEQDQDKLVQQQMVAAMKCIANRVYELADEKWGWVLQEIDER